MRIDEKNIALILKICSLYTSSKYTTITNIAKCKELEDHKLTSTKVSEFLHAAIKYNLVDDDTAQLIKTKAIEHSERKSGMRNVKIRTLYENLFKEREEDKKNFPNGHMIETKSNFEEKNSYEQMSLF